MLGRYATVQEAAFARAEAQAEKMARLEATQPVPLTLEEVEATAAAEGLQLVKSHVAESGYRGVQCFISMESDRVLTTVAGLSVECKAAAISVQAYRARRSNTDNLPPNSSRSRTRVCEVSRGS